MKKWGKIGRNWSADVCCRHVVIGGGGGGLLYPSPMHAIASLGTTCFAWPDGLHYLA